MGGVTAAPFKPGDRARILTGPCSGHVVTVTDIQDADSRVPVAPIDQRVVEPMRGVVG